jgi:hypothetical protein
MTAVAMRASTYQELMQEALHEFKAWERRMVSAHRKEGRRQRVPGELGGSESDDGRCIHPECVRPAVLRGMCRRHHLQWYLKSQKKAARKGLESGS